LSSFCEDASAAPRCAVSRLKTSIDELNSAERAAFLLCVRREAARQATTDGVGSMSELHTETLSDRVGRAEPSPVAVPLVLVADANRVSRGRRARQLEARGYRVCVARTPFEAIVKASCHLPDVILVDGSLGEGDIENTTTLLSTCPATAHIPVVRLTPGGRLPALMQRSASA
jgi:PleD family two-component response regulator